MMYSIHYTLFVCVCCWSLFTCMCVLLVSFHTYVCFVGLFSRVCVCCWSLFTRTCSNTPTLPSVYPISQTLKLSGLQVDSMLVCDVGQYTATHCNTLQHTATHRSTLQHLTDIIYLGVAAHVYRPVMYVSFHICIRLFPHLHLSMV